MRFGYICTEFPWELQVPPAKHKSLFADGSWRVRHKHKYFVSELMPGLDAGGAEQVRKQMHLAELFSSGVGCSELTKSAGAWLCAACAGTRRRGVSSAAFPSDNIQTLGSHFTVPAFENRCWFFKVNQINNLPLYFHVMLNNLHFVILVF